MVVSVNCFCSFYCASERAPGFSLMHFFLKDFSTLEQTMKVVLLRVLEFFGTVLMFNELLNVSHFFSVDESLCTVQYII